MTTWKRNLLFVWLSQFLSISGFSLALPFAPYYIQHLGITDPSAVKVWTAVAQSATAVGLTVMSPIWGMLADRFGRKLMMLRANGMAVIILMSMAFAPNVAIFVFLRFLQGFFTGTMGAAMTFVAASAPSDRQGFALGSLSAAVFSGNMIGPMAGGLMADAIGYRPTFLAAGTMLLVSTVLVLSQVREEFVRPEPMPRARGISRRDRIAALGPGLPILLLLFFMSVARTFDKPLLPLYIQQIHGRLEGAARLTGIMHGIAAVGAGLAGVMLGRLADRVPPPLIGMASAVGAGLFTAGIGAFPVLAVIFPLCFFRAFSAGGLDPVFMVWLSRVTPPRRKGMLLGFAASVRSVGWGLSPLGSGTAAVCLGIRPVFAIGMVFFVLLVPLIRGVSRKVTSLENAQNPDPGT